MMCLSRRREMNGITTAVVVVAVQETQDSLAVVVSSPRLPSPNLRGYTDSHIRTLIRTVLFSSSYQYTYTHTFNVPRPTSIDPDPIVDTEDKTPTQSVCVFLFVVVFFRRPSSVANPSCSPAGASSDVQEPRFREKGKREQGLFGGSLQRYLGLPALGYPRGRGREPPTAPTGESSSCLHPLHQLPFHQGSASWSDSRYGGSPRRAGRCRR